MPRFLRRAPSRTDCSVVLAGVLLLGLSACPAAVNLPVRDAGSVFQTPVLGDGGATAPRADAGEPGDAGTGPVSDAGIGTPDGGPGSGTRLEGEVCDALAGCIAGLICAVEVQNATIATVCRADCGAIIDGARVEVPERCGGITSCQSVYDDAATTLQYSACLPVQYARDLPCAARGDADACALGRACVPVAASTDAAGATQVTDLRCKDVCPVGAPGASTYCSEGEGCLIDPITEANYDTQLANPFDDTTRIACAAVLCPTPDAPGCPCDDAQGYTCAAQGDGAWCVRPRGVCGDIAPYIGGDDLPFEVADLCNEVEAHRYCDRAPYAGVDEAAVPLCWSVNAAPQPSDGICIAVCAQMAFDYDGDGDIDTDGGEGPLELNCAAGAFCDRDVSRRVGLFSAGAAEVPCDPDLCPLGEACASCGGAECVTSDVFSTAPSVCAAVLGTCQPVMVQLDAGPAGADAGSLHDGGPG